MENMENMENTQNTENTENTQNNIWSSEDAALKENLRVQKTAYIKQQLERKRAAEDARLERLQQEQEIIQSLRESIDESIAQTEEARKHNQEFQKYINMQVYESNGITEDKMTGMSEYKSALYRGSAAVLFFLSLVMVVLCGVLHGFDSGICLLMFAYTGMQGALLSQEKKQHPLLDLICKILYILAFPTMLSMFVCYELKYGEYDLFLPYTVILGVVVTVLGTISYFLHNPYMQDKKRLRDAQSQIRNIERMAEKEVRKRQKTREKEERSARKLLEREEQKKQQILDKAEAAESGSQQITDKLTDRIMDKIKGFPARFRFKKQDEQNVIDVDAQPVFEAESYEISEQSDG